MAGRHRPLPWDAKKSLERQMGTEQRGKLLYDTHKMKLSSSPRQAVCTCISLRHNTGVCDRYFRKPDCRIHEDSLPLDRTSLFDHRGLADKEKAWLGPLWMLRARMAFFVSNLAFYLQVGVHDRAINSIRSITVYVLFPSSCGVQHSSARGRLAFFFSHVTTEEYLTTWADHSRSMMAATAQFLPVYSNAYQFFPPTHRFTLPSFCCVVLFSTVGTRWTWLKRRTSCFRANWGRFETLSAFNGLTRSSWPPSAPSFT